MSDKARSISIATVCVVLFAMLTFIAIRLMDVGFGLSLFLSYGLTVFVGLPVLAGILAGMITPTVKAGLFSIVFGFVVCLAILLVFGAEGVICAMMATPIVIVLAFGGAVLGSVIRRRLSGKHGGKGTAAAFLIGLLLVGCSGMLEGRSRPGPAMNIVETIRAFPVDSQLVWDSLLEFQEVTGEKPWLLSMGLPVPQYCTIEGSGVGAIRTCYFDQGVIEERISVWEPPYRLVMQITKVTLPGRDWLRFLDASYELTAGDAGHTTVRRTTRIASVLRPRFYWSPLEDLATQSEHDYLFNAVAAKLAGKPNGNP